MSALPGYITEEYTGSNYGTTFARAKIFSALSTVFLPLYNYDTSNSRSIGPYIGFEADGMIAGYLGCYHNYALYPYWRSTINNGAYLINPDLCPLDKYGYDTRCRGWYDEGKRKAAAGNGTLHITAPYLFPMRNHVIGQTITMPLIDPGNNNQVGQAAVDFLPGSGFEALRSLDGVYPILITPESNVLGHDTVVGPKCWLECNIAIEDLFVSDDTFKAIVEKMKAGERGSDNFDGDVTGTPGQMMDQIIITYAPVILTNYRPVNSSIMASGVEKENTLVYSLGLAETQSDLLAPFQNLTDISQGRIVFYTVLLSALVVISTMIIIFIAFKVTSSMTEPIIKLLDVLKDINCMRLSNDDVAKLSDYTGSCLEVDIVYKTMEVLFKVVLFANHAFFSGDLEVSYQVNKDSARLFTRLDNKKAIAVVSNNLGNTMLSIYRTMRATGEEEMCGLSKKEVIVKGVAYFTRSIKLGETAYDQFYNQQGWSEECLVFMQFLANRYFNRALFFLTSSCDSENQKEAESLGLRDLNIAGDMDIEIVDQCLEMGFKIDRVERSEMMMSRVRGLIALADLGYSPDELFIEDRIKEVYQNLKGSVKNPSHELFTDIRVAGRMQKLDTELIKYFSQVKDYTNAARTAIRMLVEDEYIFPGAEQEAMKALLSLMNAPGDKYCPKDEMGDIARELGLSIETLEHENDERLQDRASRRDSVRESGMRAVKIKDIEQPSKENASDTLLGGKRRASSAVIECSRGDVIMELF